MLMAANVTKRDNYILFTGDSRVREVFHEVLDQIAGAPRIFRRKKHGQTADVQKERVHAVSILYTL